MLLAFIGALLVSQGAGHLTLASAGLRGDILMVVATLFAAIYSIGAKRLVAGYEPVVVTGAVACMGALFLFPLMIWEAGGLAGLPALLALPAAAWLALLLLGLGAGALANIWWMRILGSTTAARAGMTLFLIPVVSTSLSVIALGETLTPVALLGAALVLLGVALVERDKVQAAKSSASEAGMI
jgi:drug/metabolite transporter (DMT)-like permease